MCITRWDPTEGECSTQSKRWKLLGLTVFEGAPVICIIIFVVIRIKSLYNTGMYLFAEVEVNAYKDDFFDKKIGPFKLYPGGLACLYKGKEVLCMF